MHEDPEWGLRDWDGSPFKADEEKVRAVIQRATVPNRNEPNAGSCWIGVVTVGGRAAGHDGHGAVVLVRDAGHDHGAFLDVRGVSIDGDFHEPRGPRPYDLHDSPFCAGRLSCPAVISAKGLLGVSVEGSVGYVVLREVLTAAVRARAGYGPVTVRLA